MPGAGSNVLGLGGRGFFVQSASFHHLVQSTGYRGLYDNLINGRQRAKVCKVTFWSSFMYEL